jgi:hypothetical protein
MDESKKIKVKAKPRPVVKIKKTIQSEDHAEEKTPTPAISNIKINDTTHREENRELKEKESTSVLSSTEGENILTKSTESIPKPKSRAKKSSKESIKIAPSESIQDQSSVDQPKSKPEIKSSSPEKPKSPKHTTKKETNEIPAVLKSDLIYFMDEIMLYYQDHLKKGTLDQFYRQNLTIKKRPEIWTTEHVGAYLLKTQILKPSSGKKDEYEFDETRWGELKVQLLFGDPNFPITLLTPTPEIKSIITEQKASNQDDVRKNTPITELKKQKSVKSNESDNEKSNKSPLPEKSSVDTIKFDTEESTIKDRIAPFPRYLLKRISAEAQRAMEMGILEIDRGDLNKLEWAMEHIHGARMFFDPQYPAEKEILDSLDEKTARISQRLEVLRNQEADRAIRDLVIEPLVNGKFEKILRNWGSKYGADDCAYEIIRKIGFRVKKIPLSEMALRKRIVEILKERFPEKATY